MLCSRELAWPELRKAIGSQCGLRQGRAGASKGWDWLLVRCLLVSPELLAWPGLNRDG